MVLINYMIFHWVIYYALICATLKQYKIVSVFILFLFIILWGYTDRGIVCETDKIRETSIYTVIHCLWNWRMVCEADKIGLKYYRPNKNSTLFMKVLLVGIEMVNTKTKLTMICKIILVSVTDNGLPTFIKFFLSCQFHRQ